MRILITGATGLIGKKLIESLILEKNYTVRILTRNKKKAQLLIGFPIEIFGWNPLNHYLEEGAFDNVDIIINLAGENIASHRWSEKRKLQLLKSRVKAISFLLEKLEEHSPKSFRKIISASAIGFYGNQKIEVNEESKVGNDFLAKLCQEWEAPLVQQSKFKYHIIRIGLVLDPNEGALSKMLPLFDANIAGKIANGKQYMSWIHVNDLIKQFLYLIQNSPKEAILNGTAPSPLTNQEFTQKLASKLQKFALIPAPKMILKMALGEMSSLLVSGQKVQSKFSHFEDFNFEFPTLDSALEEIFPSNIFKYQSYQWFPIPKEDVFKFFKHHENLIKMTPPKLNLKIVKSSSKMLEVGCIIHYKFKQFGLPISWKTRITRYEENNFFIDEQISGPFKSWQHEHNFISLSNGTLVKDLITYQHPIRSSNALIRAELVKLFKFRSVALENILSTTTSDSF